jgi:hypothetical protein
MTPSDFNAIPQENGKGFQSYSLSKELDSERIPKLVRLFASESVARGESGVIRATEEGRRATAKDPPA